MSTEVLTGPFLDFGNSFWGSDMQIKEYPGLLSKGFSSTGKYGIGFFSVFMWGNHIRATTCRYDAARNDTQVLEFGEGLSSRPLLRKANSSEIIRDGGTRVRVWLGKDRKNNWLLNQRRKNFLHDLERTCIFLCPSIDVNVYIESIEFDKKSIIKSSDWIDIEDEELLKTIWIFVDNDDNKKGTTIKALNGNLRSIRDSSGDVVLRACISPRRVFSKEKYYPSFEGTVTVGGFRTSSLSGIIGILTGNAIRASRDSAVPIINKNDLAKWSSEQAELIPKFLSDPEKQAECAEIINLCGGKTGNLAIACSSSGWLNYQQIAECYGSAEEVILIQDAAYSNKKKNFKEFKLKDNVIAVAMEIPGILEPSRMSRRILDWPEMLCDHVHPKMEFHCMKLVGVVIDAFSRSWSLPMSSVLENSEFSDDNTEIIREIGEGDGEPVSLTSDVIRKPKAAGIC
jgi:hypothetical protein